MNGKQNGSKQSIMSLIDKKVFFPGVIALLLVIAIGAIFPTQFETFLTNALAWIMSHFKWLYIVCTILVVALCAFLVFSKYGDIRFGGKNARPSISNGTWFTLTLTGTIAVGICFYGVSGPVNMFMNPPEFLNVEAGTAEAIIPTLEYCFLHYGLPPYFLIVLAALGVGLVYYNGKRSLKGSSALYPLIGEKTEGLAGHIVNIIMVMSLVVCGTNMGLAVIQLNSGIGTVAGMNETPAFEPFIIIFYTVLTVIFATSGVHKLMGKLSNINAACYAFILIFVLLVSPVGANRLLGTLFTSLGEFINDFIPMITFADPITNSTWQNSQTMYYYSWNIVPGLMSAFFYASIAYGRTLRQFVLVNCVMPCGVVFLWYVLFGGTAMFGILDGSDLWAQMQQFGDGIATFAFLDTLPLGTFMKWFFLIVAVMTFITFSDSIAYSFPMMFMKRTEIDASKTNTPKILNAAVALFMGALTFILLYVGGYDALNAMITVFALPAVIVTILMTIAAFRMLLNRKKYDATYIEELKEEQQREEAIEAMEKMEAQETAEQPAASK